MSGQAEVTASYPQLPHGRHGLPREYVEQYQRDRLIAAVAGVAHARGLECPPVSEIVKAARVSRTTFYEHFSAKEECLSEALWVGYDVLFAPVRNAYAMPGTWPERLCTALSVLLEGVLCEPSLAALCLIHAPAIPGAGQDVYAKQVEVIAEIVREGRKEDGPAPTAAQRESEELLAAGILTLIARRLVLEEADMTSLLPQLVEMMVALVCDEEEARRWRAERGERPAAGAADAIAR